MTNPGINLAARNAAFQKRDTRPVDNGATHVLVRPMAKNPLELYGGIENDKYLNKLHESLAREFSPFIGMFRFALIALNTCNIN